MMAQNKKVITKEQADMIREILGPYDNNSKRIIYESKQGFSVYQTQKKKSKDQPINSNIKQKRGRKPSIKNQINKLNSVLNDEQRGKILKYCNKKLAANENIENIVPGN